MTKQYQTFIFLANKPAKNGIFNQEKNSIFPTARNL